MASVWDATGSKRSWQFLYRQTAGNVHNIIFSLSSNGSTSSGLTTTWTPSANTWYHIAVARQSGTTTIYLNGTSLGSNGTVTVEVSFDGALPPGARPDMSVDGTIEVERLARVLSVGRPAVATTSLYRLERDGRHATRVAVRLGKSSVRSVEVLAGLQAGDVVVLSDMSAWDRHPRVLIR